MPKDSKPTEDAAKPSAIATTRNMADAVSYLARVAADAGLRNIAVRLNGIRTSLLISARCQMAERKSAAGGNNCQSLNGDPHERRKPS
jgi:hypothetical protein